MTNSAYIRLVPESNKESLTIQEVKEILSYYQEITSKTGTQLEWDYDAFAFPYEIKDPKDGQTMFGLISKNDRYKNILVGVDVAKHVHGDQEINTPYVQITLPENATYGDKGKANEICRFLAKKLQGKLEMFNGRTMYFYDRK